MTAHDHGRHRDGECPGCEQEARERNGGQGVRCEAVGRCAWPDCDCDCDCFIPTLEGAGQHSLGCRTIRRKA